MLRGIEDEPRAVEVYSEHFAPVTTVGFMVRDDWGFSIGYSPDGLVGDDGLIEVKSRRAKKHLTTILADEVPVENMAQLQCGLLVSGREWIDYVSYCGGMPLYVKRVEPDQRWFDAITAAVERSSSPPPRWSPRTSSNRRTARDRAGHRAGNGDLTWTSATPSLRRATSSTPSIC
jgi:hypothetical protein